MYGEGDRKLKLTDKTKVCQINDDYCIYDILLKDCYPDFYKQSLENQERVEKLKQWYKETQEPIPEGHVPLVSLNGLAVRLREILSVEKIEN
jgi:hypothetical protein